jgi:hypothetical protein
MSFNLHSSSPLQISSIKLDSCGRRRHPNLPCHVEKGRANRAFIQSVARAGFPATGVIGKTANMTINRGFVSMRRVSGTCCKTWRFSGRETCLERVNGTSEKR